MTPIFPEFISTDQQQWVIALVSEKSVCYICSSTKIRNAVKQAFRDSGVTDAGALHYKEAADMIIKAVRKTTSQELEGITFTDGNGKFLTISRTSSEHNYEPTHEVASVSLVQRPKPASRRYDKYLTRRRAEIRARLQKLAE